MYKRKKKNKKNLTKKKQNISFYNNKNKEENINSSILDKKEENYQIKNDFNTNESFNNEFNLNEDDFNEDFMKTARNKWRNNKKEKIETNDYELLEISDGLKIFKYSNIERESPHKFIYQYYFDKFEDNEYENAKIILFIGKTGDGKTTAINAFFNIIKGIKIEDKIRFMLIKEPKKEKGQAESQTDGLHLYYIKDINNNPLIIIDSQGFGDTRGKEYDDLIKQAFEYAFINIIDHINLICFIAKSSEARLDILIKYIFSCATSLFSDDFCSNFIILATFANRDTMRHGPQFVESISEDKLFKDILTKMDKKWWYAVESINIFYDDIKDKLSIYSFNQLNDLYKEKIVNSKGKDIEKSSQIIKSRNEIYNKIKDIISNYKNIISEKKRLPEIERIINEYQNKISNIEYKINNKKSEISYIYIPDKDYKISQLERERDRKIQDLDNQYEEKTVRKYRYVGGDHTSCTICYKNCHSPCDCYFPPRCTVFPFFSYGCDICGHGKASHNVHTSSKYVDEIEKNKINNYSKIQAERDYFWKKYQEITDEYYKKTEEKYKKERELNNLNDEKRQLNDSKNYYINNKEKINENINKIYMKITLIIMELIKINYKIKNIAMNQYHIDIENEYIDSTIFRIEQSSKDKDDEIKKLREFKRYNEIFNELKEISEEQLIKKGTEYFIEKIKTKLL